MLGKFSDKFKIVAAVLAVLLVAGAIIAYVAVSTSAGNNQAGMLAGGGTVTPTEQRIEDYGVSITAMDFDYHEFPWTIYPNETAVIGTYGAMENAYSFVDNFGEHQITNVKVSGKRFDGETVIDDIEVDESWNINLAQAGKYEAVVELDDGDYSVTFYAQINRKQLGELSFEEKDETGSPTNNREYTGSLLFVGVGINVSKASDGALNLSVTGVYPDGKTPITSGIVITSNKNGYYINLTEAGSYSVTAKIIDTYNCEWTNSTNADNTTKTLTGFTVKQSYVKGQFNVPTETKDNGKEEENVVFAPDSDGIMDESSLNDQIDFYPYNKNDDNDRLADLAGVIQYYSDSACKNRVTTFNAGTVYAKVVGLAGIDDSTAYLNYRLPEPNEVDGSSNYNKTFVKEITIKPISLNKPSISYIYLSGLPELAGATHSVDDAAGTVSTPYLGFDYQIWHFFKENANGETWNNQYDSGAHWIVTFEGDEVDPNATLTSMRNVKRNANNQPTYYEITIRPKQNYGWKGDDPAHVYVYKITITPSVLESADVDWQLNNLVFKGDLLNKEGTPFTLDDIKYAITAPGCENMTLDLEFAIDGRDPIKEKDEDGNETIVGYKPIVKAGTYCINVKGLQGEGSENYTVDGSFSSHMFVVKKKALDLADMFGTVVELDFNGGVQRLEKTFTDKMKEYGLSVYNPSTESYIAFAEHRAITVSPNADGSDSVTATDVSLYLAGWFEAKYAGYYSVSFAINTQFSTNFCWVGESGDPNDKTVYPPYVWRNFAYVAPATVTPSLGADQTISVDREYLNMAEHFNGIVNGGTDPAYIIKGYVNRSNGTLSATPVDCDADGKYLAGDYYVLLEIPADFYPNSLKFVAEAGDGVELSVVDGAQQAKVYYSVRSGLANVRVEVTNYTFGDNLATSNPLGISGVAAISHNMGEDAEYTTSYRFLTKDLQELTASELANGIPRNAGEYYVEATVTFADIDEPCVERALLTVSKKSLALTWKVDGSAKESATVNLTYDKAEHIVEVAVSTINGTDFTVALSNASGLVNASTYSYTIDSLTLNGADKDNYALTNTSFSLVIDKIAITVTANPHNITYGDPLSHSDLSYELTGAFISGDFNDDEIIIKVFGKNNQEESDLNALGMGTYTLTPVWNGNEPANYSLTMVSSTLSVTAQTLIVTFASGNTSVYGNEIDLYTSSVYSTNITLTVEEFKAVVEIKAINSSNQTVTLTDRSPVGTYTLVASLKDGKEDFTLDFNKDATYTITARNITVKPRDVLSHPYGEPYSTANSIVDVIDGSILDNDTSLTFSMLLFNKGTNITTSLPSRDIGEYKQWIKVNDKSYPQNLGSVNEYSVDAGNYHVTVHAGRFVIVPRPVTLTFTNAGTSVYGEAIDLFAQEEGQANNKNFVVCTLGGLYGQDETTKLTAIATLHLVDKATKQVVCDATNTGTVNAGTYLLKAVLTSKNFTFEGGEAESEYKVLYSQEGAGEYTVTARPVSITLNPSATSNDYGTALTMSGGYNVTSGSIVNGDTLGTLAVYDGTTAVENIAELNVGNGYTIGLQDENQNYDITYSQVGFAVTKRSVTIAPTAVTNHIYGDALADGELTYSGDNFVSESHLTALNVTAQVYYNNSPVANSDVSKLLVSKTGRAYEIRLSNANDNPNYDITLDTASFVVIPRPITINALMTKDKHKFGTALEAGEIDYTIFSGSIENDDNLNIEVHVYDGNTLIADADIPTLAVKDYSVKVSCSGDKVENYTITTGVATFSVSKLELEITFKTGASSVYGEAVDLTKAYALSIANAPVTVTAVNTNGDNASSTSPAGEYTVTISVDSNYDVIYTDGVENVIYTITKRQITLTANKVEHTYGNALDASLFGFTATRAGSDVALIGSDTIAVTYAVHDTNGAVAQDNIGKLNIGCYTIKMTPTAHPNYEVTTVDGDGDGVFEVTPRALTVTFVAATQSAGHSTYFDSAATVSSKLYSNKVITISNNVNGDTVSSILSLTAVNGDGVNATTANAPAGNYTITPTVINSNYVLADATVKGTYVIGVANIVMRSGFTGGSYPYTGAAQGLAAPTYSTVDNCPYTVQYVLVANTSSSVSKDSVDWSKAQSTMPTVTNVSNNMVCILCSAPNHADSYISISLNITPVTLTVTAKPVTLTYNDAFPEMLQSGVLMSDKYEYTVVPDSPQEGVEYAGLTTVNTYLSELTSTTNYVKGTTNAGASNITVTPVYNGSATDNNVTVKVVAASVTVNAAKITNVTVTSGHASGKYTGQAYELFSSLSATVVNNQAITWSYRLVGEDDWEVYDTANPATEADACSKTFKVKVSAPNHDDSDEITVSFAIEQNEITITADNKEIVYGNTLNTSELTSVVSYAADNSTHLTSAKEAFYLGKVNYTVAYNTTTSVGSVTIAITCASDSNVKVNVVNGTLTVKQREITIEFVNKNSTYGDAISASVLDTLYTKSADLANSDKLTVTAVNGTHSLLDTKAPAGSYTVTVAVDSAVSANYDIKYAGNSSGTYTINPRVLGVTLPVSSMPFEEVDPSAPQNKGKELNAQPEFANGVSGETVAYTASYAKGGTAISGAPTQAGEYVVTFTLTDDNYTFAGGISKDFSFTVTKLTIYASDLVWSDPMPTYVDGVSNTNTIEAYNEHLMRVALFTKTMASDLSQHPEIFEQGVVSDANDYYYFQDGKLYAHVLGRAKYEVTIELTAAAAVNYQLYSETNETVTSVTVAFHVANLNVTLTIHAQGWQYTDTPTLDGNIVAAVNGAEPLYGLKYYIAAFNGTDAEWSAKLSAREQADFNGFDPDDFEGMLGELTVLDFSDESAQSTLASLSTYAVGRYVIYVQYDGIVQDKENPSVADFIKLEKLDVLQISKKVINAPVIADSVYNGQLQSPTDITVITNGVDMSSHITQTAISRNLVGSYNVIFTINDYTSYCFKVNGEEVNRITNVSWEITEDTAGNDDHKYFAVGAIASTEYNGAAITVTNPAVKLVGYDGTFTWFFASKSGESSAADVAAWVTTKPVKAGDYWVKVVLGDSNGNFSDKIDYTELTITKKQLTLTPSGTITYGETFKGNVSKYTNSYQGFVLDENASVVTGSVTYLLADGSEGSKLDANAAGYGLTVDVDNNGHVKGLSADNYYIVVTEGKLVVNKLPVTVTIGNVTRQYGLDRNLTAVTVTTDNTLADSEIVTEITDNLTTTADAASVVGSYPITSNCSNANYTVTYSNNGGTYTVVARKVYVTLDGSNAGGTYRDAEIGKVTIATVCDDNGDDISTFIEGKWTLTVVYNGTANSGYKYENSVDVPTLAGDNYSASVITSTNDNFQLMDVTPVYFNVDRFSVDASNITADAQMYTGLPITPVFNDSVYNVNGETIYTPDYTGLSLVNATKYDIPLVLADSNNYEWLNGNNIVKFEIAAAGIYAIPGGTITYGQKFSDCDLIANLKFVYASNGQEVSSEDRVEIDRNAVKFILVDEQANSLNRDQLAVGKYRLTLETANGFVVGITCVANYNIALQKDADKQVVYGVFEVKPREITITADSSTSVYSQQITLQQSFTLKEGSYVFGDDARVITYNPYIVEGNVTDAGSYTVNATATAANYSIKVETGTHQIKEIEVELTLSANGGTYKQDAATVSASEIKATNIDGYTFASDFASKLIWSITGVDYASADIPENAGTYNVTVDGIDDNNYKLVKVTGTQFTIDKQTVDETLINATQGAVYNGQEQSHGISALDGVYSVTSDVCKDAKTYTITLTLDDVANYTWKDTTEAFVTKQFEISKATLTLTPSGSIVYGQSFTQQCTYKLTGFAAEDNENVVKGYVRYLLVDYADDAKLDASEQGYNLAVAMDGEYVEGLSSDNYNIVLSVGKLIVNKREITIVAGDSSSIYSKEVVVSNSFTLKEGNSFAWNDDKDVISYIATTEANNKSDVGNYDVTAQAEAANYIVSVDNGTHRIMPITVGVRIRATDGEYDNPNKVGSVRFIETVATNLGAEPTPVKNLEFRLSYYGPAYNNTPITDSPTLPTLAGLYTVTVADVDNVNYTIDRAYGIHTTVIEVAKKAIDPREIKAENATYTGSPIIPAIVDTRYNVDGKQVYTVSYDAEHLNGYTEVGSHYRLTLTLVDVDNYCWLDNLNATQEISFVVDKANNAIVDDNGNVLPNGKVQISGWTVDDNPSSPQVKLVNGSAQDVVFEYCASKDGVYSTVVPTAAGTYWVRASMAASSNYNAYVSAPVSFVIAKRTVTIPTVTNMTANQVYTGEMLSLEIANYDDRVMSLDCDLFTRNVDGTLTLSALNAGQYKATITLRDSSSYAWADEGATTNGKVVINWTVERQVLSVLVSDGRKIVVTGEDIVFIPDGFNSGIMTIRDNVRAHEGKYSAVITLKDKANYAWQGIDGDTITVEFELSGTNTIYIALICVAAGLCVGLAVMAVIMTVVHRSKKRKQAAEIDARSRADGWEE